MNIHYILIHNLYKIHIRLYIIIYLTYNLIVYIIYNPILVPCLSDFFSSETQVLFCFIFYFKNGSNNNFPVCHRINSMNLVHFKVFGNSQQVKVEYSI